MKKLNLLLGTLIATAALSHAVDSYSEVVGYYKKSFPAGGSLQSVALLKPVSFQGSASSVSSSKLNCSSASWTDNQFSPANGLPAYYVEITSGTLEGYVFDILSNTRQEVTVASSLAAAGSSPNFLIRAHTKLSEATKNTTNLTDYSDQATIYNSDGSLSNFLRDSSTGSGWLDATTFSEGDAVIYPNQGYILTTQSNGDMTVSGTLKSTKTAVPLYAGQVNIVTLANPSGVTKDIQGISLGTNMADFQDQVAKYSEDGNLSVATNLLWAGSAEGFYDATSFSRAEGVNIGGANPVIATVGTSTVWLVNPPMSQ